MRHVILSERLLLLTSSIDGDCLPPPDHHLHAAQPGFRFSVRPGSSTSTLLAHPELLEMHS